MDRRERFPWPYYAAVGIRVPVEEVRIKPKSGYCIGCDNKHGCKSRTPPCIDEMASRNINSDSGKQYLISQHRVDLCRDCPFLRSCWTMEEYAKMLTSP